MTRTPSRLALYRAAMLALPLALAACSGSDKDASLANLDSDLVDANNSTDPAVTGALNDQIMVDPSLAGQRNGNAVRPPSQPYSGGTPPTDVAANDSKVDTGNLMQAPAPKKTSDCPACNADDDSLTLGSLAAQQGDARTAGCAANVEYSSRWAARMPADIPLYPDARVVEAAGTDQGQCRLRIVNFHTTAPVDTLVNWYYTQVKKAGFDAQHELDGNQHILGGTRAKDNGAYVVWMRPLNGGGTDVDIVTNNGG